jgi:hypothetical protein
MFQGFLDVVLQGTTRTLFYLDPILFTMACPAAMDPGELVDQFLWSTCMLKRANQGYQLLKAREKATKGELDCILKLSSKYIHPDKGKLEEWVHNHHQDVDQDTLEQAKDLLGDYWATWLHTKEKLCELDEGLYKQAGAHTHTHTAVDWPMFVFI